MIIDHVELGKKGMDLTKLSRGELIKIASDLEAQYQKFGKNGLSLDMSRGRPAPEQLDLSMKMLDYPQTTSYWVEDGSLDCRNYGGLDGFFEAKRLFATLLEVTPRELIIGGNSTLNAIHDSLIRALQYGVPGGNGPWSKLDRIRFLCPSPGYDRHFKLLEHLGIEMIPIKLNSDGPDIEVIKELVGQDGDIKGIICVPLYSNPTGTIYSDAVIDELATMPTKATDFRIYCDNAYAVHSLETNGPVKVKNFLTACKEANNPDRALIFSSTSKITFPGSGISFLGASEANIQDIKKHLKVQTIGPDKINILRHLVFLESYENLLHHMRSHAKLLKPKFDLVQRIFELKLGGKNIATWSNPRGGYFISLDVMDNCAKETVRLAKGIGIKLTNAGATYPYGKDPRDCNIRIAPSFPTLDEIELAADGITICVELACIRKLIT